MQCVDYTRNMCSVLKKSRNNDEIRKKFLNKSIIVEQHQFSGAVVAVILWYLDLQLPMQSVPINTDVVSSNLDQGEVYNIM